MGDGRWALGDGQMGGSPASPIHRTCRPNLGQSDTAAFDRAPRPRRGRAQGTRVKGTFPTSLLTATCPESGTSSPRAAAPAAEVPLGAVGLVPWSPALGSLGFPTGASGPSGTPSSSGSSRPMQHRYDAKTFPSGNLDPSTRNSSWDSLSPHASSSSVSPQKFLSRLFPFLSLIPSSPSPALSALPPKYPNSSHQRPPFPSQKKSRNPPEVA